MQSFKPGNNRNNGYKTAANTWIDKKEVLDNMRISERTLQNWRSKGILPHYRLGGRIYYREGDLEAMMEKNRRTDVTRNK